MNAWRTVALGIAAYLVILVVTFPVSRMVAVIERQVPGLQLHGVNGSPWSGQADQVSYRGTDIGRVHWSFRPQRLLTGNIGYVIAMQDRQHPGSGYLDLSFGGTLHGSDLTVQLPPSELINQFSPVGVAASGAASLHLAAFALEAGGLPAAVQGDVRWKDARLSAPVELDLGSLVFDLASNDAGMIATVREGGKLGLSGNISLHPDGKYMINLHLQPGPDTGREARDMLDTLLQKRPGGGYQISAAGSL